MKFVVASGLAVCVAFVAVQAQERPMPPKAAQGSTTNDPRVGLKAGFRDAGEAIRNLEKLASLPKPEGFFDPKAPSGGPMQMPTDPSLPRDENGEPLPPDPYTPRPFDPVASNRPDFTNSDLAFRDHHVFVGSYHGFNTYDVERPTKPKLVA